MSTCLAAFRECVQWAEPWAWLATLAGFGVALVALIAAVLAANYGYEQLDLVREDHKRIADELTRNRDLVIVLFVEWSLSPMREKRTLKNGEELRVPVTPREPVRLALGNSGKDVATQLVLILSGNLSTFVDSTDNFAGNVGNLNAYHSMEVVLKAKPGVELGRLPAGFEFSETALLATRLELGIVQWDRDEGIYWLRIFVSAEGMQKPAKFELALEPRAESPA